MQCGKSICRMSRNSKNSLSQLGCAVPLPVLAPGETGGKMPYNRESLKQRRHGKLPVKEVEARDREIHMAVMDCEASRQAVSIDTNDRG